MGVVLASDLSGYASASTPARSFYHHSMIEYKPPEEYNQQKLTRNSFNAFHSASVNRLVKVFWGSGSSSFDVSVVVASVFVSAVGTFVSEAVGAAAMVGTTGAAGSRAAPVLGVAVVTAGSVSVEFMICVSVGGVVIGVLEATEVSTVVEVGSDAGAAVVTSGLSGSVVVADSGADVAGAPVATGAAVGSAVWITVSGAVGVAPGVGFAVSSSVMRVSVLVGGSLAT